MFVTLSLLLAAACLVPAAAKLAGHPRMRHAATHFGIAWRRYRLIGVAELAAAVGVFTGLFWQPAGLLAAAGMTLLLIGRPDHPRPRTRQRPRSDTRPAGAGPQQHLPGRRPMIGRGLPRRYRPSAHSPMTRMSATTCHQRGEANEMVVAPGFTRPG
jgi:hypothetical protein